MAENKTVRAPYNFVPFSGMVLTRYEHMDVLPPHDKIDPELKSGEIHVTLTADTPVFVSDGIRDNPHFFRGANDTYALPGSTIRGMVRQNMQILGFGLIRPGEDIEDVQIYFRALAKGKLTSGGSLKDYYHSALNIKITRTETGKNLSVPQNVQTGYISRVNGECTIYPTKSKFIPISRSHPEVEKFGKEPSQAVPVDYSGAGGAGIKIYHTGRGVGDVKHGYLLYTGHHVGKDPNHLYLFPEKNADGAALKLPKEDILSYQADYKDRENSLKGTKKPWCDPKYWALPEDGEEKPVFYVEYEGHVYFGMSLFLRIGYRNSLVKGLPKKHTERYKSEGVVLDYPRAVLGFTSDKLSYRSRVSFGDFPLVADAQEAPCFRKILAGPKPSYYPGYVVNGEHYNVDGFKLRGHKLYWLKEADATAPEKESNIDSQLRPLPAGTKFRGVIRYRNLHEDELGLLLWTLRLEEGCYQSIGMGKPYGFGRMKLTIDSLVEYNPKDMYSIGGLLGNASPAEPDSIERYINTYDTYALHKLNIDNPENTEKKTSLRSFAEIIDLFYMRRTIRTDNEVSYMCKDEYSKTVGSLPSVAAVRENVVEEKKIETQSIDVMYAALQAKFDKKRERVK